MLGGLFNALAWIAKSALGALIGAAKFLFGRASKLFSKTASNLSKPKVEAAFARFATLKTLQGSVSDFEALLYSGKSLVGIILGGRGSGKSGLGMRILENARSRGRSVAAMGFDEKTIPNWINCVQSLTDVKNGSMLLVDEGGILFSSRSAFSSANKLLSELVLVSRHKDLSVIFISQNSSNIDVNALRQADFLLLKKPSLLQSGFERKAVQKIYEQQAQGFKDYAAERGLFYVFSDAFQGFASNSLPSFWTDAAGKAFK